MDAPQLRDPNPSIRRTFVLPRRGWVKLHEHRTRSLLLLVAGVVAATAGLMGAERRVGEFQQLDFQAPRDARGFVVLSVSPRSGAARAGLLPGDTVAAIDGIPATRIDDLERTLYSHPVSTLSLTATASPATSPTTRRRRRWTCATCWWRSRPCSRSAVAGLVYLGHPTPHPAASWPSPRRCSRPWSSRSPSSPTPRGSSCC